MVLALLSRVLWLVAGDGSLDPASCLIRCLCEALTTAPSFGLRWVCYQAMFTQDLKQAEAQPQTSVSVPGDGFRECSWAGFQLWILLRPS